MFDDGTVLEAEDVETDFRPEEVVIGVREHEIAVVKDARGVDGVGFAALPLHLIGRELAAGRLQRVCPTWFRNVLSLQALLPARQPPPRGRLFLSHVAELSAELGFRVVAK